MFRSTSFPNFGVSSYKFDFGSVLPVIVDLRSGACKPSWVPPPRPYRRRGMSHNPSELEVARSEAAAAAAAYAAATGEDSAIPPSVAAAIAKQDEMQADLLEFEDKTDRRTLAPWDGVAPPGTRQLHVQADVHSAIEDRDQERVSVRGTVIRDRVLTQAEDVDGITVEASPQRSGQAPPEEQLPRGDSRTRDNPQLNPFTPEWFTQLIGAAVSAAATAVASTPRPPAPVSSTPAPRRLNEQGS